MTKDRVVAFRAPEGFSVDPLTDLLREGARELIAQAVEAELNAFLDAHGGQTDATGRRRLVRHGHQRAMAQMLCLDAERPRRCRDRGLPLRGYADELA